MDPVGLLDPLAATAVVLASEHGGGGGGIFRDPEAFLSRLRGLAGLALIVVIVTVALIASWGGRRGQVSDSWNKTTATLLPAIVLTAVATIVGVAVLGDDVAALFGY